MKTITPMDNAQQLRDGALVLNQLDPSTGQSCASLHCLHLAFGPVWIAAHPNSLAATVRLADKLYSGGTSCEGREMRLLRASKQDVGLFCCRDRDNQTIHWQNGLDPATSISLGQWLEFQ